VSRSGAVREESDNLAANDVEAIVARAVVPERGGGEIVRYTGNININYMDVV